MACDCGCKPRDGGWCYQEVIREALDLLESGHANGEHEPCALSHDTARAMGLLRSTLDRT